MNQQEALVKLATVRLAINYVLRSRAMQKQAEGYPYTARAGSDGRPRGLQDINPDLYNAITSYDKSRARLDLIRKLGLDKPVDRYINAIDRKVVPSPSRVSTPSPSQSKLVAPAQPAQVQPLPANAWNLGGFGM